MYHRDVSPARPHVLGIDDGPFRKGQAERVPVVGVMMEGSDLVEGVAVTHFPVDGDRVTDFLAEWVSGLRLADAVQAIVLGGISIAGLALVDVADLSERLGVPVLAVTRRDPAANRVAEALAAAGLSARLPILVRSPPAVPAGSGLWIASAGAEPAAARALLDATLRKARLPEPLRLAHLIARAVVDGESRGRV